ncbi:MAG: hypothetical protein NVV73_19630 [Cellvibrionaceae bacterium]|nr:hypothetical protein [Cellvibrionaceae bacterium]
MSNQLPQLTEKVFLTDGGLETSLIFLDKIELPHFAAFTLLADELGRERLKSYYVPYLELCAEMTGAGFILETPTWRANPDWAERLGMDAAQLRDAKYSMDYLFRVGKSRKNYLRRICFNDWSARVISGGIQKLFA